MYIISGSHSIFNNENHLIYNLHFNAKYMYIMYLFVFNKAIVEATADLVCTYKLQI